MSKFNTSKRKKNNFNLSFWIKLFQKTKIPLIIFMVIVLGFVLRTYNYSTWPRLGATFDEYAWTWQGINLIQKGTPVSWSPHDLYKNTKQIKYQTVPFRLVSPYLEHPPAFGVVVGGFALISGVQDMYHVTLDKIRPLALILGVFSVLMVFVLARNLYGNKVGLLSAVLYATVPTIVVGSRILQNENFFIPIWLLALYLSAKFLETKKIRYRNIAAIFCGLLTLAKVPWLAAALSIVIIFILFKKYQDVYKFLTIVLPIFCLYFVYGYYYDWNLYFGLWKFQLNRYDIEFSSIYALFQKPYLVDRFYTDGWIYWGWFSVILLAATNKIKKHAFILIPVLSYFLVFLAAIPDEPSHGWYRYPFYPFLVISLALFIKEYFNKNAILTFMFLVFIGTTLFQLTWAVAFGFSYFVFRLLIFAWGLSLLPIWFNSSKFKNLSKMSGYFLLICYLLLNIWAIIIYNEQ